MDDIKMVAVDMDGTFLRKDNTFDEPRFRRILTRMDEVGAHFVVASGNQYWQLRDFFGGYDEELSFVAENGAFVKDGPEKVFVGTMDPAAVREVIDWVYERPEVMCLVCCEQSAYAARGHVTQEQFDFMHIYYHHLEWVDDLRDVDEPVLKFALEVPRDRTWEYYDALRADLTHDLVPTTSGHGSIDLIVEGVHKANGLSRLVERWGIDPADCAAFGDGGNDIEMLRYAGHPFAVANAADDVKAVATHTCPSNDEGGVLQAMEELFFETAELQRLRLQGLLSDIEMSPTYAPRVLEAFDSWAAEGAELSVQESRRLLAADATYADEARALMLMLFTACEERAHGCWQRFPEEVYIATMKCFTRFVTFRVKSTGCEGYDKGTWPLGYVDANILRLGEYEYELREKNGKPEVTMHIPADVVFTREAFEESLAYEREFNREYLPERVGLPHSCETWFLAPALEEILSEKSNIRWFRSCFDVVSATPDDTHYLEFLFWLDNARRKDPGLDLTTLREDTSLQRAVKAHVLAGGKIGEGLGYLKQERA